MVVRVNLLPSDLVPSKSSRAASSFLSKLALALSGVFLALLLLGGVFYFFLFNRLSEMRHEEESLATDVQNLQPTEASLVLLKDRLSKVQGVLENRAVEGYFEKQNSLLVNAPEDVFFDGAEIGSNRSLIELTTESSQSLASLMVILLARSDFTSLILEEMSFSPFLGYQVKLEVF